MAAGIKEWLAKLDLNKYSDLFSENDIDLSVLPHITENDLKELGLTLGARRKILAAIPKPVNTAPETQNRDQIQAANTPAASAYSTAERRQLTVAFIDLVGSTALSSRLDPEDLREVIRGFQDACAGVITRFDGFVAKFMGDGILAYFGYPRAHEDDVERAVRAGLKITQALSGRTASDGTPLKTRIGVATGLVVVGDIVGEGASQEEAVVGETPNLAARLQELAEPGQVVIAASTRRLLGAAFDLIGLGEQVFKGIAGPIETFVVTGEKSSASRFEARSGQALLPMVGRDRELALLYERWAQAKGGEGQGVLLVGEAGIGKSRISRALLDAVLEEPHIEVRYQCSPYHNDSTLWPIIQHLLHSAGIGGDEPNDGKLDKLETLLAPIVGSAKWLPLIADLIGLDGRERYGPLNLAPQVQRAQTLEALIEYVIELADSQPTLLFLEDAHWIDATTLEFIEQCLGSVSSSKVFIVVTSRPDNKPELAAHAHVTRLTLNRLGRQGVETIVASLGGTQLPPEAVDTIISRTDGVPLFVEELTKAVLESEDTKVPASLHDSLMARLDRIPDVREVAQVGACIGREFDYSLIAAVAGRPDNELRSALEKLVLAELMFRRGKPPAATYSFKHALVQDAAYESLLKSRRQEIHKAIFEQLEHFGGENQEILAHHAQQASLYEPAINYWHRAATMAADRSAYREAVNRFQHALNIMKRLPERPDTLETGIDIRLQLRNSFVPLGEAGNALEFVREAAYLAEQIGDISREARAASYLCNLLWHLGKSLEAAEFGRQAVDRSLQSGQTDLLVSSKFFLGQVCHVLGDFGETRRLYRDVIALCDNNDPYEHFGLPFLPASHARAWLTLVLAELGEFEEGVQCGLRAIEISEGANQPFSLQQAYWGLGTLYLRQRDLAKAVQLIERAMAVTREWSLNIWGAPIKSSLGELRILTGRLEDGLDLLEQAVLDTEIRRSSATWLAPTLISLAKAYQCADRLDDAALTASRALSLARRCGQQADMCRALFVLGDVTAQAKPVILAEAERHFEEAVALAKGLKMRPMEIHISCGLANVARQRGSEQIYASAIKEAADQYRNLGMIFWAERSSQLLSAS